MAVSVGDSELMITTVLTDLAIGVESILTSAKSALSDVGLPEFVDSKIGVMWSAMSLYANTYKMMGCLTRAEMETRIQKNFKLMEIQERYEHLLEVETEWDSMLLDMDGALKQTPSADVLTAGDSLPEMTLTDARTGETTSLQQCLDGRGLVVVLLRHLA